MNLALEAPAWLLLILGALLVAAAVEDTMRLRISNLTCALILLAVAVAITVIGPRIALWQNLVVFAGLIGLGTPLFAAGKVGGGDVKLLAATGIWFDLRGALLMLMTVLLAGGLLALLLLVLRTFDWSEKTRARVLPLQAGKGIPYGIAIAVGSLITIGLLRA